MTILNYLKKRWYQKLKKNAKFWLVKNLEYQQNLKEKVDKKTHN